MLYTALKHLHVLTVGITLALFLWRGLLMLNDSEGRQAGWLRVVPHLNDTLLLTAAIAMILVGGLSLTDNPWLLAKIVGLLAYIGLGTVALKRGRTRSIRLKAFIAALGVFAYLLAVAISKQPIPGA